MFARDAAGPGGRFLLRIEDIDRGRCRPEFEAAILEDLAWLGLSFEQPVRRQSDHMEEYRAALARLSGMGLLYPCFCTRREIAAEIAESGRAPHGPDGPLYPGTCRNLDAGLRAERMEAGHPFALRLDTGASLARTGPLRWFDQDDGWVAATPGIFGDVVLGRKDVPTSYHLAATWDDGVQGVTLVTRGEDLKPAAHLHRLLQELLGLPVPRYRHHCLLAGPDGRRYAKRDHSLTLRALRESGISAGEIRHRLVTGWKSAAPLYSSSETD